MPNLLKLLAHLSTMPRKTSQLSSMAKVRETANELLAQRERLNHTTIEFLKIDLETSMTFCQIARDTHDPDKKSRNQENGRRGYDTVKHLMHKINLTLPESKKMKAKLAQLKSELEKLGEVF